MSANTKAAKNGKHTGPVIIDPVTRVEGHVKLRVQVEDGIVTDAWSTVSLYRGLEQILKGRRPEEAHHFTQRACGVCTNTHALTSLRAAEDAAGVDIPPNARIIRHLILSALMLHDHIVHFYHLHGPDWIDMGAALAANPGKAVDVANGVYTKDELANVQGRLKRFVDSGQTGFVTGADFLGGHASYGMTPEQNLVMTANYLKGLQVQLELGKAMAIFGSKNPHSQTMIVGGVTCYNALNPETIAEFERLWKISADFTEHCYLPDLVTIGQAYPEWGAIGGNDNFLSFNDFPEKSNTEGYYLKQGVLFDRDYASVTDFDPEHIREHVAHSWYEGDQARHPYQGETKPKFTFIGDEERYSWTKAPRYMDKPMEVGPLARMVIHLAYGGDDDFAMETRKYLKAIGQGPEACFSTLGRTAARCLETVILARRTYRWIDELKERVRKGDDVLNVEWTMPDTAQGVGMTTVPRGALSHWLQVENGRIANFQMVVPSTWNCGPRCANGHHGPVENSLLGTPIADADRPVELLRTVHSFDPCLACSVHVIDSRAQEPKTFKVL